MKAYIEHAAYEVDDIDWYLDFFDQVFAMKPYRTKESDGLRQYWLEGGVQLCESREARREDGRCSHLCLLVNGLEEARNQALALGAKPMAKHHWVELPDGLKLEMFEAADGAVEALMRAPKRKA